MSDEQERQRALQAQATRKVLANFDPVAYTEIMKAVALERKITYDAYVAAGFTPEQALGLCK